MKDREKWLEERRKGIGGSDCAAIIGLSRFKTAFDVYADKLRLVPSKEDNEAMRQGRDLEEYVAQRFCEETGKKVRCKNQILKNSNYPFALANVDRIIVGEDTGLECKTANVLSLKRYKNGEYPEEYYCQCMHYMAVTGYSKWYLAVLIFGTEFKIFEIKRDEEEIAALMKAESEFWENHVLKKIPPPPAGAKSNNETLSKMFPDSNGKEIFITADNLCSEREKKKLFVKKLERDIEKLEQEIKLMMGENEIGYSESYKISWKHQTRSTLDKKRLENDLNVDLSKYMKETKCRLFKIQEVK